MIHLIRDLNKKISRGFSRCCLFTNLSDAVKHFLIMLQGEEKVMNESSPIYIFVA